MNDSYRPRHQWNMTRLDENDSPTELDWCGYEGEMYMGRIRKELHGPTKGKWHWAGAYPKTHGGSPPTPNAGYAATAREAVRMCEEYWKRCKTVMVEKTKLQSGFESPSM